MSSTTTATSGALAGAWFGELASALHGSWQAAAEHPKLGGGRGLVDKAAGGAARVGKRTTAMNKEEEYVVACSGAISDATLCLLLDRFAPS
ncbi:hypothetical protein EJB05_00658, partial [Eragrostis curvula]